MPPTKGTNVCKNNRYCLFGVALGLVHLFSCSGQEVSPTRPIKEKSVPEQPAVPTATADKGEGAPSNFEEAQKSVDEEGYRKRVARLSADEFEGRAPASLGEEKTTNYLHDAFKFAGLKPANGESYFQEVPLVEIETDPSTVLSIKGKGKRLTFAFADDFAGGTVRVQEKVQVKNSEIVFVGYGINAPEHDWNDYAGIDVKGKTVLMLVNDPGFASGDAELFTGRTMTYYGRWTYKFEQAAKEGAVAAIIIHDTAPASYGWAVVRNSWTGPQFSLATPDDNASRCALDSWVTLDAARQMFAAARLDFEQVTAGAAKRGFKPVRLGLRASVKLKNQIRKTVSKNVIGVLPGTERPEESIIYTAHWDHLGKDPTLEGDQIYNGALDNATGTAALIELAEAFVALRPAPRRSIVFFATAAEEQGLLGAYHYVAHPLFPLNKTVAVINMDALNIWGPMRDIRIVGHGQSELDGYLVEAAKRQRRVVRPEMTPERGAFYRSDHFPFAKLGVPVLNTSPGSDHRLYGEKWAKGKRRQYQEANYHRPSDEYDEKWDLSGTIEDLQLLFAVGYRLGMEATFPNWNAATPYRAKREAMMGQTTGGK